MYSTVWTDCSRESWAAKSMTGTARSGNDEVTVTGCVLESTVSARRSDDPEDTSMVLVCISLNVSLRLITC